MAVHEPVLLIEATRIRPLLVGRKLDEDAAPRLALFDCPFQHLASQARSTLECGDSDALDLATPCTLAREARDEGEMQGPHNFLNQSRDRLQLIGIRVDGLKSFPIL